jgi:hypothetical protein
MFLQFLQTIAVVAGIIVFLVVLVKASEHAKKEAAKLAAEKAAKERREQELREQIITAIRGDYVSGYTTRRELGWVRTAGCESPSFVEANIRLQAAERGANAVLKLHWKIVRESEVAGYGKKGNPYYETVTTYSGEGLAVVIEKKIEKSVPYNATNATAVGYTSGWVAIDGNNMFGTIYNELKNAEEAFRILNKFLFRLQSSPYKYHLFWDGAFIKFARAVGITHGGESLSEVLLGKLSISGDNLTVSELGRRADETIVSWAAIKSAAIISGDHFSKKIEDDLIIEKSKKLADMGLLLKYNLVSGEIVIPELKSL